MTGTTPADRAITCALAAGTVLAVAFVAFLAVVGLTTPGGWPALVIAAVAAVALGPMFAAGWALDRESR